MSGCGSSDDVGELVESSGIQDVDPRVTQLGGGQNDKEKKEGIGDRTKQKLEEEGSSVVPGIDIGDDIPPAADLRRLIERLDEACIAADSKDKKGTPLGPQIPEWLKNLPFSSLDFVKGNRQQVAGPLGAVPISSQEQQLLKDILNLMMGLRATYITVKLPENSYDPPEFTVDPTVDVSLGGCASRILPLCGYYSQVVRFMEEKDQYPYGLINHALSGAINILLEDYICLITQLEEKLNRKELTFLRLLSFIEETMDKFAMLACITKDLSKSGARGSAVLNLLHDRMLNLAECNPFKNVMMQLTQAAADPYMSMLFEWLNRGIIDDPYEEFMVVDTKTGITDEYWEKRYTIIPQNVPTFLKMHENVILRTGKYLNVIRQSGQEVRSPEEQKPIFSTTDASYSEVIERTYNFASKQLFELFMDEKNLMGRLRSVKRFFLLDEGDFILQLISKCEEELKKNIDDVRPKCLQMLFKFALEDSSANNDIYKDDIICTLQPTTLMGQVQRILSNETEEDRLQISGLQGFTLGYRDTWPVSLVLDSKNIACYQMIFRYLFFCKYVEKLLCRVWIRDKVMKSFPPSASHTCSSAFGLRQCMLHFIQNIEYYMMFDVIESNWQTFCNKIQMVDNVEEVLVLHTDFIYSVMKGCLLTSPELLRILSKLISICVSFASFIEESPEPAPNSHEDSQSFEQTISKLELEFSGMMYTFMEKIKELSCENPNDPFFSVLYKLDFNMYSKKKHEDLQKASSPEASVEDKSGPSSG